MQLTRLCRLLLAQGNSLTDLLLLSHLAEEGIHGASTPRASAALGLSPGEVLAAGHNLSSVSLVAQTRDTGRGRPIRHTITGKGLELLLSLYSRPDQKFTLAANDLLPASTPARRSPVVHAPAAD